MSKLRRASFQLLDADGKVVTKRRRGGGGQGKAGGTAKGVRAVAAFPAPTPLFPLQQQQQHQHQPGPFSFFHASAGDVTGPNSRNRDAGDDGEGEKEKYVSLEDKVVAVLDGGPNKSTEAAYYYVLGNCDLGEAAVIGGAVSDQSYGEAAAAAEEEQVLLVELEPDLDVEDGWKCVPGMCLLFALRF